MQALNPLPSLSGLSKVWVTARRNDGFYLSNKILSVIISIGFAWHTEALKFKVGSYADSIVDPGTGASQEALDAYDADIYRAKQYNILYWNLFIFYAFHAVDELIELYAVYFKREKGALGLLLELNNFLGVSIIVWLIKFLYYGDAQITDTKYADLYSWLNYQLIFFYVVLGFSFVMILCMYSMQKSLTRAAKVDDQSKRSSTTINN